MPLFLHLSFRMNDQKKMKSKLAYAKNREQKKSLVMDRLLYINILKEEFHLRRKTNSFYSLRSFAADLKLDPIHLSRIFRNKKGLSRKKAETISRKLRLTYEERCRFNLLVSASSARSKLARNLARMGLKNNASGLQKRFNLIYLGDA